MQSDLEFLMLPEFAQRINFGTGSGGSASSTFDYESSKSESLSRISNFNLNP